MEKSFASKSKRQPTKRGSVHNNVGNLKSNVISSLQKQKNSSSASSKNDGVEIPRNFCSVETQTEPFKTEFCGCASADLQMIVNCVRKEIKHHVQAYIEHEIQNKEVQLCTIRKVSQEQVQRTREQRWCSVCGDPAQIYRSNAYYCSDTCQVSAANNCPKRHCPYK